jgi:hypothetical protein
MAIENFLRTEACVRVFFFHNIFASSSFIFSLLFSFVLIKFSSLCYSVFFLCYFPSPDSPFSAFLFHILITVFIIFLLLIYLRACVQVYSCYFFFIFYSSAGYAYFSCKYFVLRSCRRSIWFN